MAVGLRHLFTWAGEARVRDSCAESRSLTVLHVYGWEFDGATREVVWFGNLLGTDDEPAVGPPGPGDLEIAIGRRGPARRIVLGDGDGSFVGCGTPPLPGELWGPDTAW